MRRNIIIKALVLGTIGCAFSATGFAANVQNGHGQGITDSTTEVIKLAISLVAMGDIGIHTIQLLKKANNGIDLKNIIILNHWELLLM